MIAHIRHERGNVLENTHPFTRELWGKNWIYAHNGQLKRYQLRQALAIGQTDSEKSFCWILNQFEIAINEPL